MPLHFGGVLPIQSNPAWNLRSSWLSLPTAGIRGVLPSLGYLFTDSVNVKSLYNRVQRAGEKAQLIKVLTDLG